MWVQANRTEYQRRAPSSSAQNVFLSKRSPFGTLLTINYGDAHMTDGFVTLELLPDSFGGWRRQTKKTRKRKTPPQQQRRHAHLKRKCVAGEDDREPYAGAKIRVRFQHAGSGDCWYTGRISWCRKIDEGGLTTGGGRGDAPTAWRMGIKYDDGVEEETGWPDPDIKLMK